MLDSTLGLLTVLLQSKITHRYNITSAFTLNVYLSLTVKRMRWKIFYLLIKAQIEVKNRFDGYTKLSWTQLCL